MSESPNMNAGPARQTGETAKQEASATADRAKASAGEVAATAREQAGAVTGEARQQARQVVGDLRERAVSEADSQAKRTAGNLRQWADDLHGMADSARDDSPVRSVALQAADQVRRAADTLEQRGLGGLVENVQSFARRRPGAFLGAAALAGMAVGRMAKAGSKSGQSDGGRQAEEYTPPGKWGTPTEGVGEPQGQPYGQVPGYGGPTQAPGYGGRPTHAPEYGEPGVRRYPEVS